MTILDKLLRRSPNDLLWDRYINQAPLDPNADMAHAIRTAPAGDVFPAKSDIPEPGRMASDLFELASFFGGSALGVTDNKPTSLLPPIDGSEPSDVSVLMNLVVVGVPADVDPDKAAGIGGQHVRREAATVVFSLAAYIRELGYQAIVSPIDKAVAKTAGVAGSRKLFVADDAVLTDLPLAHGAPKLPDTPINARPTTAEKR